MAVRSTTPPSPVRGRFREAEGLLRLAEGHPVRAELLIATASFDTGMRLRDRHVLSDDFLDASTHPALRFVAEQIIVHRERAWTLDGNLSIRGVTDRVAVDATVTPHEGGLVMQAASTLDRHHFGVRVNRLDVAMVGRTVAVELRLVLVPHLPGPTKETP